MREEIADIKVTQIDGNWHIRCFISNKLFGEMCCELREDIGYCVKMLLRQVSKMGFSSPMADASRKRPKNWNHKGRINFLK